MFHIIDMHTKILLAAKTGIFKILKTKRIANLPQKKGIAPKYKN